MDIRCKAQEEEVQIYQLRLRIKGVSPMIWRRLLIRSDNSIADLHFCIQIAFGWSDTYLNQFVIYGKPYGVYHDGGISFSDNPRQVYLRDFQFRGKKNSFMNTIFLTIGSMRFAWNNNYPLIQKKYIHVVSLAHVPHLSRIVVGLMHLWRWMIIILHGVLKNK